MPTFSTVLANTSRRARSIVAVAPNSSLQKLKCSNRNRATWRYLAAASAAALCTLVETRSVSASDIYWANPSDGNFSTAANWIGNTVPGGSDFVHLNASDSFGDSYEVNLTNNVTNSGLLATATGTLVYANLAGYSWNLQQSTPTQDALVIGQSPANQFTALDWSNGNLNVTEGNGYATSIGQQANATGYFYIETGDTFNNYGPLYIGEYGRGTVLWEGGTTTVTGPLDLAFNPGSSAEAGISSSHAVINGGFVDIGTNGTADFSQTNGIFNVGANLTLATYGTATGTFELSGGNLNVSGYAFVNYDSTGSATFTQTGGNVWVGVGLIVGTYSGPGYYNLSKAGSTTSVQLISSGEETIGAAPAINGVPNGTFNQYNYSGNFVGYNANGSIGSAATLFVGKTGSGVFNLFGGVVQINGTLSIGSASGAVGVLNQSGGSIATTTMLVGDSANSFGTFTATSGSMTVNSLLTVGNSGTGILSQTNSTINIGSGGNAAALIVGNTSTGSGTFIQNANSFFSINGAAYVGVDGTGIFNQTNGSVSIGYGIPNTLYIGRGSGSGTYLISGSANLFDNGDEIVGWIGTGVINQSNGTNQVGTAQSPWHLYLGFQAGSSGTYNLSGQGSASVYGVEMVGNYGTGVFNQSGGNQTINGQLIVGTNTSAQGLFLLSDPNSLQTSLTVTGNEVIGSYATGSGTTPGAIFQQSGGTHTVGSASASATLTIAQYAGSTATYLLSGGTLNINGSGINGLTIGGAGNGVLNQSGGTLNTNYEAVGNTSNGTVIQSNGIVGGSHAIYDIQLGLASGGSGTYQLSGGTLNASEEEIGVSGTGTFNQGGGTNQVNTLYVADANGKGIYLLSAGTLQSYSEYVGSTAGSLFQQASGSNTVLSGGYNLSVGGYGEIGIYNQTGGSLAAGYEYIGSQGTSGTGTVNMNGGVAQVGVVLAGGGPSGNLNLSGSAVFNISGPATNAGTQPLIVYQGSGVSINGNGRLNLLPHTAATFTAGVINSLSITGSGTLDLSNNAVDLPSTTLTAATVLVRSAYANGTWSGTGITSSSAAADTTHLTALGIIQNNQSGTALYTSSKQFDGVTPGTSDILVKYTYYGDTNLDGKVDGSDYSRIDNGYLTHLTGWFNGDFNYDNVINGSDYTLIDNAFNRQGAQLTSQIASPTAQSAAAVPEPGIAGLLAINAAASLRRRNRRK